MTAITTAELTAQWRTEQVLHGVARCMREGKLDEDDLGFGYRAVCECAEAVQALAGRVQREAQERVGR